jgi:mono/diheme cytochrome c family protein
MTKKSHTAALALSFVAALSLSAQEKAADPLPDGEGKDLVQRVCTGCHGLDTALEGTKTAAQWKAVVDTMVNRGAEATDPEIDTIVKYLAKNFGKSDSK